MNARITATVTRKKFPKKLFAFLSIIASTPTLAWDGYDWERGSFVEIGKGNLVRDGREIEYYDLALAVINGQMLNQFAATDRAWK